MSRPLVSIIINCFNGEKYLHSALNSILKQTYSNWEIIFWDNCSTDRSAEIALSFGLKLKYYREDRTKPLGGARQSALRKAKGEYITFLDCDDEFHKWKLEKLVELALEKNYVLCYGGTDIINAHGTRIRKIKPRNRSGYIFRELLVSYEINMQSVLINKSYLKENKLNFDSTLTYSPDFNLFMKIASEEKVGVLPEVVAKYRIHGESLSSRKLEVVSTELLYTLKHFEKNSPKLLDTYKKDFDFIKRKVYYYDALHRISINDYRSAKTALLKVMFRSPKYFALLMIVVFRFPSMLILRLCRRGA